MFPNLNVRARPRENVVVVYPTGGPKEGPRDTSVETKSRMLQLIKPREDKLQVRSVRMVSRGGVLVEAASGGAAGRIMENQALKEGGFTVERPKVVLPKVMIYDIPNDISEDEVKSCLVKQNPHRRPEEDTAQKGMKVIKKMAVRDRKVEHWVLECIPEVRDWPMSEGRVYIDWSSCRVKIFCRLKGVITVRVMDTRKGFVKASGRVGIAVVTTAERTAFRGKPIFRVRPAPSLEGI